jgi:CRISPR/Cas system-associated exonuclease Cas4 (RecB family)
MSERYDRVIRASEVGQYVYCAQAWWLGSVRGLPSSRQREMAAGEMVHRRHGRRVRTSLSLNRLAYVVLLLAMLVGIIWLIQWLGG